MGEGGESGAFNSETTIELRRCEEFNGGWAPRDDHPQAYDWWGLITRCFLGDTVLLLLAPARQPSTSPLTP